MATTVGHTLVAGLFYLAGKRDHRVDLPLLLGYGLFANGPDLDFLPGIAIGSPSAFHHGITHSFGFGVGFVLIAATVLTRVWKRFADFGLIRLMVVGYLLYVSHILVDAVTLDNSAPFGAPVFWPVSQQYFHLPVYLFPNVLHAQNVVSLHNLIVALREVLVFAPLMLLPMLRNQKLSAQMKALGGLGLVAFVVIILALLTRSNPYF